MKSICFISNRYPNVLTPTRQVFVQKLVWAMADLGVDCTVISPVPVNQYFSDYKKLPLEAEEYTSKGARVKLYFPRYISFGQKKISFINTAYATTHVFTKCVQKVFSRLQHKPDAVYGHFFTPAGICAARIGKAFRIPAFAVFGESTPWSIHSYGKEKIKKELASLAGIISVSSANKAVLQELNIFPSERTAVFPNGYQADKFYPRHKQQAREKFGFKQDEFILSYVGQFSDRKGVLRVAEAADNLPGISVAFAGKGPLQPNNKNCIHSGAVKPSDIPDFLSASDVFVLPTLNEGCSNAIVEAMACGLPVISSALPFNMDILGTDNAILLDPKNIDELREAIMMLKNNPEKCTAMKQAALNKTASLTLEMRATNIKTWMENMINFK